MIKKLTIVGNREKNIVLEDPSGEQYELEYNNFLEHEISKIKSNTSKVAKIVSPKIIQAHLRMGKSVDEVSELTDASFEEIEKYSGPVQNELNYIASSSLNGIIIGYKNDDQLFSSVIKDNVLSAHKSETGEWIISVDISGETSQWVFNSKVKQISAFNDVAKKAITATLRPQLVELIPQKEDNKTDFQIDAATPDLNLQNLSSENQLVPKSEESTNPADNLENKKLSNAGETNYFSAVKPEKKSKNDTAVLLETLRKKRSERTHSDEDVFETQLVSENSKQPKIKKRAEFPSWDDIMFNTKSGQD